MKLDDGFVNADALVKKTGAAMVKSAGKIIAALTAAVACLLTFTDVSLGGFGSKALTGTLVMMLIAVYLIYFSLEDAGERLGEEGEDFLAARAKYAAVREKIGTEDMTSLREFCSAYTEAELKYRRELALAERGYRTEELEGWLKGEKFDTGAVRVFKRVKKMKPIRLTPQALLAADTRRGKELSDPDRLKLWRMAVRLIPTSVCTVVTVSVVLTMKDGLTAEAVIEGILKLATLPIVAIRGYSAGYRHVTDAVIPWTERKTELLTSFLEKRSHPV